MTFRTAAVLLLYAPVLSAAEPHLKRELPSSAPAATATAVHTRLAGMFRPQVDIQDASIRDVMLFLMGSGNHYSASFIMPVGSTKRVSYHAAKVSELQLLDDLCARMGLHWYIDSHAFVHIGTRDALKNIQKNDT